MKILLKIIMPLYLALLLSGCATPYMMDRANDAADIFTMTYEWGGGIKSRIGPFAFGCGATASSTGLRGGALVSEQADNPISGSDCPSIIGSYDGSFFGLYNYETFQPFYCKIS